MTIPLIYGTLVLLLVFSHKLTLKQKDRLGNPFRIVQPVFFPVLFCNGPFLKEIIICIYYWKAYSIVAALDDFYACYTVEEARNAFDSLYSWMRRCRLQPMKDAATTLRNHKEKILAYFYHRITNAVCEGINSMIQAAKRKARGFNTYEGFASMIYLVAGKLQLAVPNPF